MIEYTYYALLINFIEIVSVGTLIRMIIGMIIIFTKN